ncbi:anthocyanidin 3-O-glucosyltransferase 2-like [Pistacia vera]|uniref:anthocyanidin 3-O-glucosyltransferase 2-like n=1 Tax=Pistacia vera TaxID=55513 RepID=UPI0012631DE6|nr:anthocyanidin 3-O-glucosyltransferase 2-like [Pistacia vera]
MAEAKRSQKHIAVLTFPFTSHVAPLLSLTQRLSQAAPELIFSFFSTPQSNASHFPKDGKFDNIKPYDVDTGLPEGYVHKGQGPPRVAVEYFLKATPGNFQRAIQTAVVETGMEISCLISDAFLWFAAEMAKEMQAPWLPFWTGGLRPLLVHLETDNLRQQLGINGPGDQTLEFLPGFSTIRAVDLPDGVVSGSIDSPFSVMLLRVGKMLPNATAVAINSFEELDITVVDTIKSRLKIFLNVGPLILTSPPPPDSDKYGCLEWLNGRETSSVAYISFGSVVTPSPSELAALAEALEENRIQFLWSFRGNPEEHLPKGFLERTSAYGKIVPWAPQLKILEHSSVGVFVTHGGAKSITESIIGGVPMICRAFFADQGLNQRTMETVWGIGLGVEGGNFAKDRILEALEAILYSEKGKMMREKVAALKRLAFQAVEPGGRSTANFNSLIEIITTI